MRMYEEALFIAFETNSTPILNYIKIIASKQRNLIVETIIDHHKEK